jgi:hypothetical protein
MDPMLMATVIPLGFFIMVAFIIWMVRRSVERIAQSRVDVQMKLIEKFGSAHDLSEFLNSPAGRGFVTTGMRMPNLRTKSMLLSSLRSSLIMLFMGLAFILVPLAMHEESSGLILAGGILLAIGLGMFVSAVLSMKLGRAWGIVGDEQKETPAAGPGAENP